jgi:hypothetical protein
MKATIKTMWTESLRSGEFQKGTGALCTVQNVISQRNAVSLDEATQETKLEDEFCCLGVLCELYRRSTGNGEWVAPVTDDGIPYAGAKHFKVGKEEPEQYWLPKPVARWAGLVPKPKVTITPKTAKAMENNLVDESFKEQLDTLNDGTYSMVSKRDYIEYNFNEIADLIEESL